MKYLIEALLPDPKPCPVCGETQIQSWFASACYGRFLPFWVEMRCPGCGRKTKPKLLRSRAVLAWNRKAKIPKNCRECAYAKGCKSWYGGLFCKYNGEITRRAMV